MTQSASSPYPIRPIEENEVDGFLRVDEHAFNTSPGSDSDRRVTLDRFEFDRTLAAFDDATPVGVTMCYSFQLSVPGQELLPAAGVTFVAVLPTHRRRGVLSSLMRRQLADVRDRAEPLAILWASEAVIYGRYGYGRASWQLDFTLRRGEGRLAGTAASAGDGLRLRITEPEAALPELAKVYDAVLASRPGMFGRNDAWWRSVIYDPADWPAWRPAWPRRPGATCGCGSPNPRPPCPSWPRSTTRCWRAGPGCSAATTCGGGT